MGDSQQGRLNALHRGSVSATVLALPYSGMAKQFGLRELVDLRKSDIEDAGSSIAGMGNYIKSEAAAGGEFSQRLYRVAAFSEDGKGKETLAAATKFFKDE